VIGENTTKSGVGVNRKVRKARLLKNFPSIHSLEGAQASKNIDTELKQIDEHETSDNENLSKRTHTVTPVLYTKLYRKIIHSVTWGRYGDQHKNTHHKRITVIIHRRTILLATNPPSSTMMSHKINHHKKGTMLLTTNNPS